MARFFSELVFLDITNINFIIVTISGGYNREADWTKAQGQRTISQRVPHEGTHIKN